jgi:hypothetical protein
MQMHADTRCSWVRRSLLHHHRTASLAIASAASAAFYDGLVNSRRSWIPHCTCTVLVLQQCLLAEPYYP